ncbi:MAG: hypothetical protein HY438_01690 [DPANN group archaeon]|nr:hypothetical protein [DPANN group archaeon]
MEDAVPEWFYNTIVQYMQGPAKWDNRTLRPIDKEKVVLEDIITLGKSKFRFVLLAGNTRAQMGRRCGIAIPERDTYQPLDGFTPEAREQILYQLLLHHADFLKKTEAHVDRLGTAVKKLEQYVVKI